MTEPTSDLTSGELSAWPPIRRLGPDNRYHLEERLASGGAATVWRAYDEQLERSVAIKILHPHLVGDEDTVARFERESRNAARLHHPNAIAIYDSGRVNDVVYLVMEYVDGPTLKEVLADHGALEDWHTVAAIGEQIALALAEAHRQDLIHRDIKPANILFTTEGITKVVDFGIAKALSTATADLTAEGMTVGTAAYIAPEQYSGAEVDGRADLYALGMVMYECLTGRPPYTGDTPAATAAARLTRDVVPPRQIRADVDRGLEDIVLRITRRDPEDRYPNAGVVASALRGLNPTEEPHVLTRALLDLTPPSTPSTHAIPPVDPDAETDPGMPTPAARSRTRQVSAFLAGVVLAALAFLALRGDSPAPVTPGPVEGAEVLPIAGAADYDPLGDELEHPDEISLSYDRDVQTAWTTERYRADDALPFGGTKTGVGLYFDLGDATVGSVLVDFLASGASVDLYRSDAIPDAVDGLIGWGAPIRRFTNLEGSVDLDLPTPTTARYWLLWLTTLPVIEPGIQQAGIAEIRFLGVEEASEAPTDASASAPASATFPGSGP